MNDAEIDTILGTRIGVVLTEMDKRAVAAISPNRVTYMPASYDKRFARDIQHILSQPEPTLTFKQWELVWSKVWRYRRQIRDKELLAVATRKEKQKHLPPCPPGGMLCGFPIRVDDTLPQPFSKDVTFGTWDEYRQPDVTIEIPEEGN